MSTLEDGVYIISLSTDAEAYIGVEDASREFTPVVTHAAYHVWTIKKNKNGTYRMTVGDGGTETTVYIKDDDEGSLVGDTLPTGATWEIELQKDGVTWTIMRPSGLTPRYAWTVEDSGELAPVTLQTIHLVHPASNQLWKIYPFVDGIMQRPVNLSRGKLAKKAY